MTKSRRFPIPSRIVLPLFVTALAVAMMLPGLIVGPSFDASIFSTVAWRLSEGDGLYRDVWDHKPPAIYLPYLVANLLTHDPAVGWVLVWTASVAAIGGMAVLIERLLNRTGLGASAAIAAGLATLAASSYLLSLGGGVGETFALLPLAGSLLAATSHRWLLAGILAGLAVAVTPQSLPALAGISVVATGRTGQPALARIAPVASGVALVLVAAAAVLWVSGSLPSAWDALVTYSAAYRSLPNRVGGGSAWSVVPWTVLVLLPLVVAVGMAGTQRGRLADVRLAWSAAAWLVFGLASIGVQGRFYAHYAQPLVVPMAVLAGLGIHAMWVSTPRRIRAAALGVPLLVGIAISLGVGAVGAEYEEGPIRASNERAAAVAAEIRGTTGSEDAIFVWGNDARLYELADRRPATRYVYLYPLLTPGYSTQEQISDLLTQMEAMRATIVVDSGSLEPGAPGLPPMLIARPVATDGRDLDLLDPVREYVASRFGPERLVAGWAVYRASR